MAVEFGSYDKFVRRKLGFDRVDDFENKAGAVFEIAAVLGNVSFMVSGQEWEYLNAPTSSVLLLNFGDRNWFMMYPWLACSYWRCKVSQMEILRASN